MISKKNINSFWASLIVEELVRNDITFFCISPGSRSTPLTVAAAQHPQTTCHLVHDERGAAFMALGYARATGKAAVLICTSGTAAANYYPAIVEASMDDVPMIVLTADRPPELLDTAANQTIHQHNMYGTYTRWHFTLPTPNEQIKPSFVLTTVDQAVQRSFYPLAGPVHINCMFREPLAPIPQNFDIQIDKKFEQWQKSETAFTKSPISFPRIENNEITALENIFNTSPKGLVILGRLNAQQHRSEHINRLLKKLDWPVYADIASGFRLGPSDWPRVDEKYFYSDQFLKNWQPGTILHLGATFISKRLQQWIEKNPPQHYIHIYNNPRRIDPAHLVTQKFTVDLNLFCDELVNKIRITNRKSRIHFSHEQLLQFDDIIQTEKLNEPSIATFVSRFIPSNHGLFLGNSMPIRDMNTFADYNGELVPIVTNRGASGIDGNIATAVGFAHGHSQPVTALLGDVTALHDLNSLYLMKNSPPIILIIINNDGGGIFSFLPISKHEQVFEKWFETPHGLSFEKAAHLFDLPYAQPTSTSEFIDCYTDACANNTSKIIQVKTDKKENVGVHHHLEKSIQQFLDSE